MLECVLCVLLEQLDVAHDELLPVDEDHGHFLLCQQLALQQGLMKDLHSIRNTHAVKKSYTSNCIQNTLCHIV